jgi:hypothetical protein
MLISDHLERVKAFEQSLARLDPIEDTELYVVFLMRAATNRVNAALHALDLTEEGPVARGTRIGDMNHTYKPVMDFELPAELHAAFSALKSIEDLRPEYVRGPHRLTPALSIACREAYAGVVAATDAILRREQALS